MSVLRKKLIPFGNTGFGIRPWSRHSVVLLVAGAAYSGVGLSYIASDKEIPRKALSVAVSWMPIQAWGWVFLIVGVFAMASCRWPSRSHKWGYIILTGLSSGWGSFYFMGVIFVGNPVSNISLGFVWYLLAFMWWAVSGLINPPVKVVIRRGSSESG